MEQDPSMRGMLSFLEIAPAEKLEMLRRRSAVDAASAPGDSPAPLPSAPEVAAPAFGDPRSDGEVALPPACPPEPEPMSLGAPNYGAPQFAAPTFRAPKSDAPEICAPGIDAPEVAAPYLAASTAEAPNSGALDSSAPKVSDAYVYRPSRPALRLASTAHDGHTHGEQALLATLWRLAMPSTRGDYRLICIGERTLAGEVPMAYSTVQENLRSLAAKLAIEIRPNGPHQPKTYVIYSDDQILLRRRAAGLTHIIRRTSAVTLVNPASP